MAQRSLLDYFAQADQRETAEDLQAHTVEVLQKRLEELANRLSPQPPINAEPEAARSDDGFSSQIEAILKRREALVPDRTEKPAEPRKQPPVRLPVEPPPLADRMSEISSDFAKFVQAVQLVGQAADRFLGQPGLIPDVRPQPVAAPVVREVADNSDTMVQMVTAFRQMTAELATLTQELRRAPKPEEPRFLEQAARRVSRDDAELYRLQDDLDELRERLATMTRRRSRNPY